MPKTPPRAARSYCKGSGKEAKVPKAKLALCPVCGYRAPVDPTGKKIGLHFEPTKASSTRPRV